MALLPIPVFRIPWSMRAVHEAGAALVRPHGDAEAMTPHRTSLVGRSASIWTGQALVP